MNLAQLRSEDPWSWEVTTLRGVVRGRSRSCARQWIGTKRAAKVRQHPDGSDLRSEISGREAGASMIAQPSHETTQARAVTDATVTRIPPPMDRHWFVNNPENDRYGYCAACNLPAGNWRHAPRVSTL